MQCTEREESGEDEGKRMPLGLEKRGPGEVDNRQRRQRRNNGIKERSSMFVSSVTCEGGLVEIFYSRCLTFPYLGNTGINSDVN